MCVVLSLIILIDTDVLIDQISDKSRLCQTPLSAQERQVMMQVAVERRGVHCKECVGAGPRAWNGTDFRVGAHRHVLLLFLFLVLLFFSLFLYRLALDTRHQRCHHAAALRSLFHPILDFSFM